MLFQKITFILAAAASAVCASPAASPAEPTGLGLLERAGLSKDCTSVVKNISPILTSTPTAPYSLINYIASQTQWTTLASCEVPWVTDSMSSQFTSYMSARSSWQAEHKSEIKKFVSACADDLIELGEDAGVDLSAITQTCDEYLWATSTARPTSSNSNNNSGDKDSDKGAAAHMTISIIGAALAAGIMAVGLL
ncbi:hypothetical protein V2G26_012595 [Clonostachys chloroleuca]|uniref:Infection structure specific protein n=1 Tax=Clonostachys chloroleuca TaxID=1926264 RepID=A0AA35VL02_9HYPO|nr:unnamed protein product [Clonostachys chloroleuca]